MRARHAHMCMCARYLVFLQIKKPRGARLPGSQRPQKPSVCALVCLGLLRAQWCCCSTALAAAAAAAGEDGVCVCGGGSRGAVCRPSAHTCCAVLCSTQARAAKRLCCERRRCARVREQRQGVGAFRACAQHREAAVSRETASVSRVRDTDQLVLLVAGRPSGVFVFVSCRCVSAGCGGAIKAAAARPAAACCATLLYARSQLLLDCVHARVLQLHACSPGAWLSRRPFVSRSLAANLTAPHSTAPASEASNRCTGVKPRAISPAAARTLLYTSIAISRTGRAASDM